MADTAMSADSTVAHTPGPWRVDTDGYEVTIVGRPGKGWRRYGIDGDWTVAKIDVDDGLVPPERVEADARLIAAAPELLEALEMCVEVRDRIDQGDDEDLPDFDAWLAQARAAIAKARGNHA